MGSKTLFLVGVWGRRRQGFLGFGAERRASGLLVGLVLLQCLFATGSSLS